MFKIYCSRSDGAVRLLGTLASVAAAFDYVVELMSSLETCGCRMGPPLWEDGQLVIRGFTAQGSEMNFSITEERQEAITS